MENSWFKQNTKKMCEHSRKFYWNNETYRNKKKLKMAYDRYCKGCKVNITIIDELNKLGYKHNDKPLEYRTDY